MPFEPELNPEELDRFWDKVAMDDQCWMDDHCWNWRGTKDQDGYGLFKLRGRMVRAHRLMLFLSTGEWPGLDLVCHRCDTPGCVRPGHLFRGSPAANSADMVAKGRAAHMRGDAHPQARVSAETVREIRRRASRGALQCEIARRFGITPSNVSAIVRGKSWRHLEGA